MGKIAVLDKATIDKIAAGEVVERPSSVVKELVENAIDAGASAITVEIKDGGISFIRITDNGSGIAKEDVPIAFLRHSTSKIRTIEDLLATTSLGFRGEALSSIAAVAQVELLTKTREAFAGVRYIVEGSEEKKLEEIGCPDGTTFLVKNLFYNIPARRKYLKTAATEAGYSSDLMERMALSRPDISFKFINNGKTVLHTTGSMDRQAIIYHLYGRDIAAALLPVKVETDDFCMEGFIGKPVVARGNRNYENYFINGRYIKSSVINRAIEDAYKPYLMQHKYPFTSLHITLDSNMLDVNVHPAKREVRLLEGDMVYQSVYHAVQDALSGKNMIVEATTATEREVRQERVEEKKETLAHIKSTPEPFEVKRKELLQKTEIEKNVAESSELHRNNTPYQPQSFIKDEKLSQNIGQTQEVHFVESVSKTEQKGNTEIVSSKTVAPQYAALNSLYELPPNLPLHLLKESVEYPKVSQNLNTMSTKTVEKQGIEQNVRKKEMESYIQETLPDLLRESDKKQYTIIGQLFATYWLVQMEEQLFIIDQHAAHEKILYEQTMKRILEKQPLSQMISPPMIVSLSLREEETLRMHKEVLTNLGFEIEPFGGKEYCITAVPADLCGISDADLFLQILDGLVEEKVNGEPELLLEKVASMSCKAAVKGNMRLSAEEAKAMIEQLLSLDNPYHCPHGRPTTIMFSKYEIEKRFKRIV